MGAEQAVGDAARRLERVDDRVLPWCTYTDPELAHVGLNPAEAAKRGIEINTFTQPIRAGPTWRRVLTERRHLPRVLMDDVQIAVVLRNLLANALDAASQAPAAGARSVRVQVRDLPEPGGKRSPIGFVQ